MIGYLYGKYAGALSAGRWSKPVLEYQLTNEVNNIMTRENSRIFGIKMKPALWKKPMTV